MNWVLAQLPRRSHTERRQRWACIAIVVAGLLFLLTRTWSLRVEDITQDRLNRALPPLKTCGPVAQSFVVTKPNLCAIEVLLVRYDDQAQDRERYMTMHLHAGSEDGPVMAAMSVDISQMEHNDPVLFSFTPPKESRGHSYFLVIESGEGSDASLWYTEEDAYGDGMLFLDGEAIDGDLRFKTFYEYTPGMVCADLLKLGGDWGWLLLLVAGVLFLPSLLFVFLEDSLVKGGLFSLLSFAASLSLALVPLLLLWGTTLNLQLASWMPPILGLLSVLGIIYRLRQKGFVGLRRQGLSRELAIHLGSAGLLGLLVALRFLQIRDVSVPLWVDSLHHTMITQLIRDAGMVPQTYRPFMPVDNFIYHFGFHSVAAMIGRLTGAGSQEVVLVLGQVLNVLCATSAYLLAKRMSRSRMAGFFTFVLVAFISTMPAYYVSWGRYTQLTGMVILPVAMIAFMRVPESREHCWRDVILAAFLATGLFLSHYRVTIFYASFCLVYTAIWAWGKRSNSKWLVRGLKSILVTLGCAAVLVIPWLYRLGIGFIFPWGTFTSRLAGEAGYTDMPWGLLWSGNNRLLLLMAAGGLLLAIWQKKRDLIVIGLWVLVTFVLLNPTLWGGTSTWLVTNASLVISLYLPVGVLAGYFLASVVEQVSDRVPLGWKSVWGCALASVLVLVSVWGAWNSVNVVNPVTVLVKDADMIAYDWIKAEIPEDALFLVNTRPWQLGMYMGTDGGWWIPLLTGRETTMPPVLYTMGSPDYVEHVNRIADLTQRVALDDACMLDLLRQAGVTHVYVGAKGGPITPSSLLFSPHYRRVYSSGEVWIFEFMG